MSGIHRNMFRSEYARAGLIAALVLASLVAALSLPPVPENPAYHQVADAREILGVPNMWNVLSNLAFVLVGVAGLIFLASVKGTAGFVDVRERLLYAVFYLSILLIGVGSAWYHLAPSHATLTWDRMPMAVAFMAFLSITFAERINVRLGVRLCGPLLLAGVVSVIYWHFSELAGRGDLRFYALVQFFPMLAVPLMVLLFPARYTRSGDLLGVLACYALAKACEFFDKQLFELTGIVSGHTMKHIAAAAAGWLLLNMLRKRRPL
ncbi:MAG: ceramidase domain-containing protein [Mariprofundaceae bacterium]|nr:ceramidase domain-containing protein [Mariprofundaceae bacterium]